MIKITITENQGNQRLDRFLKKYFDRAPLSHIYKLIRKDVKVNGKRQKEDAMLAAGDELTIYLSEEDAKALQTVKKHVKAKRQFRGSLTPPSSKNLSKRCKRLIFLSIS